MKIIEVDEELYQYIAGQTQSIGESASDILRRLLNLSPSSIGQKTLDLTAIEVISPSDVEQKEPQNEKSAVEISPVLTQTEVIAAKPQAAQAQMAFSTVDVEGLLLDLLNSAEFQQETKAVTRFLSILSLLYTADSDAFSQAIDNEAVQGRTRTYFAKEEQTLLACGNHTKPKQIPDSPYWVITNNNSGRKMIMLEGVMREMRLSDALINEVKDVFVGG